MHMGVRYDNIITLLLIGVLSITISVSVCLSLLAYLKSHTSMSKPSNFLYMLGLGLSMDGTVGCTK